MDLTVSDDVNQFFKQIWIILGITQIQKSELIYYISYKLNLPYKPTTLVKKIREALVAGILIEKDKLLELNAKDLSEIQKEQRNYRNKLKQNRDWIRIEESIDPWMTITEEKVKTADKKSLSLNALIRNVITDDALEQGTVIAASNFHPKLENQIIQGTIDDDQEKGLMFEIDLKNTILTHNCQEFVEHLPEKILCKHFYRIFMYLKKKDIIFAKDLLVSLSTKKEEWTFQK